MDSTMASDAKRQRLNKSSVSTNSTESHLTADMDVMIKTKKIMEFVNKRIKAIDITDQHMIRLKSYIVAAISNMDKIESYIEHSGKKTTVGIFGKSGEGKSSLLSAILEEEDLFPSGSFGACTAVVTQVEANLRDSNYTAEIELISKEEWEKELQDLFNVLSDETEDRDEDLFITAKEKITALYGEGADKKTLDELKNHGTYAEINDFLSTSNKIITKCNASEFANDVACYIQHSESSPGGWYWPLVKSVTIKIPNCRDLLEHIVLVDLPGTGDCNKTRDQLWKDKLRNCSSVWVVSDINRATTDKGPWEMLKHCIQELGPGGECKSINFICTKSDDINPRAYYRSARLPDTTSVVECMIHRNNCTKNKMKEKIESLNPGMKRLMERFSMDFFTVSSKAFFEQNPTVEKNDTEISKLQDVLKNLNKSINRQLARDYVSEAKGLLSLIQSFLPNTDEELMKGRFHDDLKNDLSLALGKLDCQFDKLQKNLDQCLSNGVLESVERSLETAKTELIEPEIDSRGYHKILKALCKNNGQHFSRNWERTLDLNMCLTCHMRTNIYYEFSLIFSLNSTQTSLAVSNVNEKTPKSVKELLDNFSIIQSDKAYSRFSMFHHIQNYIKIQENKLRASCISEVIDKKKEMYDSIKTTIKRKMTPGYEKAAKVSGKGSFAEMQNILKQTIESLKNDMFSEAKEEVLKRFKTLKLYIKDHLKSELNKSIDLFHLTSSTVSLLDVSRQIEDLENLSEQLSE